MRMSWFSSLRAGRRRKGKRQQLKAAPLRVRQLERRRVLDGAVASVVVSTVVVADAGQPAPTATTTNATDAPPIVAPVESPAGSSSNAVAYAASLGPAQGLAGNVPPVLNAADNQTLNEGQLLDLSGTGGAPALGVFVDPDLADSHTGTVDWGDGSPVQNTTVFAGVGSGALGGTHTYADNGVYTVTVNVSDDNGGSSSDSFSVTVKNLPPVLNAADNQTLNEGQLLDLSGMSGAPALGVFADDGVLDTHTATVNWGDGSPTENATVFQAAGSGALGGSHTYADDGVYTVTVTVTDDDGGAGTDTFNVTVKNVAPFVELTGPTSVDEGSANNWNLGPVVDPGTDTVTQYIIHWGDGNTDTFTAAQIAGMSNTISHTYADGPNSYTIAVDLVDEDGTFSSVDTLNVTVNNVSPFVELSGPSTVDEGSLNNWNLGPVIDPGTDTVTQYVIHWGDGNTDTFTAVEIASMSGAVGHTYADGPNSYTITVDLVDEDGTHLAVDSLAVAVNNVPPVVDLTGPTVVNEGAPNNWLLGSVVDPGTDTVSQYVIHWGDGNTDTFTAAQIAGMGNTIGHTYADGPNNYTISVDLVDEDGSYSTVDTLDVTVNNVAPFVDLTGPTSVIEGTPNNWNLGSVVDPGTDTVSQYIIHWGDGNTDTFTTAQIAGMSGTIGHTYAEGPNNYTIEVDLVDEDGTYTSVDMLDVAVGNFTPTITLTPVSNINENDTVTLSGSYTDTGRSDGQTLVINWGDPNYPALSTFTIPAIHNPDGTTLLATGTILSSTDGTQLTIDTIDATTGQVTFHLTHQYLDDGTSPGDGNSTNPVTINATITDDDGQVGNAAATFNVNNVAPKFFDATGASIDEGHVATIGLNVDDPGTLDVFTFNVDWRDGSTGTIGGLGAVDASGTVGATNFTWTASTRQLTLTHLYADNANYQVVVRMADDDMAANFAGAPGAANYVQQTTLVAVANLAPTLAGTTNLTVDEGSAVTLVGLGVHIEDLGFDNPDNQTPPPLGNLTTEEFAAFSIDWGDGFSTTPLNVVDRVSGSAINSTTASLTTAQFLHAEHYYADDGVYTVTVRMADDNMGAFSNPALFTTGVAGVDYVDRQFQVLVKNVTPTLGVTSVASQQQTGAGTVTTTPVTPATTIKINESGTVSFAAGFTDPGFSLDPNPASPAGTAFPRNEIFRYYINWGDNRETVGELSAADVASLTNGGPTVLTSGAFDTTGLVHTYADDGTYTVTVRLADDNMGAFTDTSKFANGVGVGPGTNNGGDYVETTFTVVVNNIAPSFVPQPGGANVVGTDVTSQGFTTINVAFSDPGFDNTANLNGPAPPTITDTLHESFTHVIDWGDGTVDAVHTYADSSTHDVTITQTGPGGTQTFTVPGIGGLNQVLTLVSSQDINNPGAVAQPFTYVVDWGDGNVQTITLMLKAPGAPTVNGQTAVGSLVRTSGNVGVATTGSFGITHQYLGPPDPLNPTNDIIIAVSVVDDNNALVSDFTTITNPGINTFNVAIDTTPDVPRLVLATQPPPPVLLTQQSAAPSSLQPTVARIARSELTTTSDRYLELVVVSPDGNEIERYRLSDEALVDLRGLFATLPDNRYKIFLVRTDNNSRRLVMDVFVRHGRVIDPSDDSEGTRDRPPTAEGAQQINAQQKNVPKNNAQPNGAPQQQVVPLQNNPLLNRVPDEKSGAANEPALPTIGPADGAAQAPAEELSDTQPIRSRASMRWALPLAGLGLVASRESWSERLGAALESADDGAWQRLRRAGRLGKSGRKSGHKSLAGQEKQSATANNAS